MAFDAEAGPLPVVVVQPLRQGLCAVIVRRPGGDEVANESCRAVVLRLDLGLSGQNRVRSQHARAADETGQTGRLE